MNQLPMLARVLPQRHVQHGHPLDLTGFNRAQMQQQGRKNEKAMPTWHGY
jgi:hypothetical protein